MKLLDVVHPAAKTLVDISLSQDAEVCVRACVCMCVCVCSGRVVDRKIRFMDG